MSLVKFAEEELDKIKKDEQGMQDAINENILDLVKMFSAQGHSGMTASYTIQTLERLCKWLPLTPLTGEDDEWNEVISIEEDVVKEQNNRCSSVFRDNRDNSTAQDCNGKVFSNDGGKSYYSSGNSFVDVTFPYHVPVQPERIILSKGDGLND